MANNRMVIVCNKCLPNDNWGFEADVCYLGKWYPIGSYRTKDDELVGSLLNEYLDRHAHTEDVEAGDDGALVQNENPVRLTYETWVRDMPAIKKWTP